MANPAHHHRRKKGGLEIDEEDRKDYSNEPLEQSVVDDDSPFRDASTVDAPEREEQDASIEIQRVPRDEVPLEDLLAPPKRKGKRNIGMCPSAS